MRISPKTPSFSYWEAMPSGSPGGVNRCVALTTGGICSGGGSDAHTTGMMAVSLLTCPLGRLTTVRWEKACHSMAHHGRLKYWADKRATKAWQVLSASSNSLVHCLPLGID